MHSKLPIISMLSPKCDISSDFRVLQGNQDVFLSYQEFLDAKYLVDKINWSQALFLITASLYFVKEPGTHKSFFFSLFHFIKFQRRRQTSLKYITSSTCFGFCLISLHDCWKDCSWCTCWDFNDVLFVTKIHLCSN